MKLLSHKEPHVSANTGAAILGAIGLVGIGAKLLGSNRRFKAAVTGAAITQEKMKILKTIDFGKELAKDGKPRRRRRRNKK